MMESSNVSTFATGGGDRDIFFPFPPTNAIGVLARHLGLAAGTGVSLLSEVPMSGYTRQTSVGAGKGRKLGCMFEERDFLTGPDRDRASVAWQVVLS